jgi:hypothetical protein
MRLIDAKMISSSLGDHVMLRYLTAAAIFAVMLAGAPAFAVTSKDKMATCKFGADDQKLEGPPRKVFMKNCMSNKDDPRGSPVGMPPPTH